MKIGAHVSIAGSLDLAIDRAVKIGAECIQIFGSAPQRWQFLIFPEEQIKAFRQKAERHSISPVFVHAIYLINLASENPYILERSIKSLVQYLRFANKIGAEGVVFHVGSHKGKGWKVVKEQVFRAVGEVLERTSSSAGETQADSPTLRVEDPKPEGFSSAGLRNAGLNKRGGNLILENSAGAGGIIGAKFSELGDIVRAVKDSRLRVCLDTAHAFESGYSLSASGPPRRSRPLGKTRKLSDTSEVFGKTGSLDETLAEFDAEIGLDRLVLIHANDSKTPLGSNVDRHENIGQGHIGTDGFRLITNHSSLSHLPFIIETPPFNDRGSGEGDIEILRRLSAKS